MVLSAQGLFEGAVRRVVTQSLSAVDFAATIHVTASQHAVRHVVPIAYVRMCK